MSLTKYNKRLIIFHNKAQRRDNTWVVALEEKPK